MAKDNTTKDTDKTKTPTGLNKLSSNNLDDINADLQRISDMDSSQIAEMAGIGEVPTGATLPEAPAMVQGPSFANNLARALSIFAASQGEGGAETGLNLLKQYQQQDAAVREMVQQQFINQMAIARTRDQQAQFAETAKTDRTKAANDALNTKIRALEAQLAGYAAQIEAATAGGNDTDVPLLNAMHKQTQDLLNEYREQQGIFEVPTVMQLQKDLITGGPGAVIMAGLKEKIITQDDIQTISGNLGVLDTIAGQVAAKRIKQFAKRKVQLTPELLSHRAILEAQIKAGRSEMLTILNAFDAATEAMPDPITGEGGDEDQFAAAVMTLAEADPDTYKMLVNELSTKWFREGRFPNTEQAEWFAGQYVNGEKGDSDLIENWPAETYKAGQNIDRSFNIFNPDMSLTKEAKGKLKNLSAGSAAISYGVGKLTGGDSGKKVILSKDALRAARESVSPDSLLGTFKPTLVIKKSKPVKVKK